MVLLVDKTTGTVMVTQSEDIDQKIREMAHEIKFEVFCNRTQVMDHQQGAGAGYLPLLGCTLCQN